MKINEILFEELDWEDTYSAAKAMRKYPNKWIHFSNIPKLGVNPQKSHNDPPGIYFYPIKWLSDIENRSGFQYAINTPYYFICDLKKTKNTINIAKITPNAIEQIVKRNGWIDAYHEIWYNKNLVRNDKNQIWRNNQKYLKDNTLHPGAFFWSAMDYLVMSGKYNWLQLLKGVDMVVDTGKGIIAHGEPYQAFVLSKTNIKVLEFGDNKQDLSSAWYNVMKIVANTVGGEIYWKHKKIYVDAVIDGKPVTASLFPGNHRFDLKYYKEGFEYNTSEKFDWSLASIESEARNLVYWIKKAAQNGTETGAKPKWNLDSIKELFTKVFGFSFSFRTHIKDGVISYSWSNDTARIHISLKTDATNTLNLEMYFEIPRDNEHVYKDTFDGNLSIDEVSNKTKENIKNSIPEKILNYFINLYTKKN